MSISPNRIPRKFVEAVQEKKRKENQEKAAKDTKAIRQSFGKNGDKMDYQSSKEAQAKAKKPTETVKKGQDVISDKMSFGKAFRAARNEGMKTFTWRGKKYGTKLKSEVKKKGSSPKAKSAPATQLRPDVATPLRAEAEEKAVKEVEQNIDAAVPYIRGTSPKPRVDTTESQIERATKAMAKIDKSISQMQNNPSGYLGLLSGEQKNQRIKLRERKKRLQKRLKELYKYKEYKERVEKGGMKK
jgi:hypothetical protein